jgi:hypothetical protein
MRWKGSSRKDGSGSRSHFGRLCSLRSSAEKRMFVSLQKQVQRASGCPEGVGVILISHTSGIQQCPLSMVLLSMVSVTQSEPQLKYSKQKIPEINNS